LLVAEGLSASDTEQKEIANAAALIREILIRLVTIALSANFDSDYDGDALLNVINNFTENIVKLDSIPTKIRIFLVTEHHDWLACLRDMVAVIKSIHSNAETFTKTLAYLEQVK